MNMLLCQDTPTISLFGNCKNNAEPRPLNAEEMRESRKRSIIAAINVLGIMLPSNDLGGDHLNPFVPYAIHVGTRKLIEALSDFPANTTSPG
jgi:hypothetical protein